MPLFARPNRDLLNQGLDIFRDAVRGYMEGRLGSERTRQFLAQKQDDNGHVPPEIDIGDFAALVEENPSRFPERIRSGGAINRLKMIRRRRNEAAHPRVNQDMDRNDVLDCLEEMVWFLERAGETEAENAILDLQHNGTPLDQARHKLKILQERECTRPNEAAVLWRRLEQGAMRTTRAEQWWNSLETLTTVLVVFLAQRIRAGVALPVQQESGARQSSLPPSGPSVLLDAGDGRPEGDAQASLSPSRPVQVPSREETPKQSAMPVPRVHRPTESLGDLSIFSVFAGLTAADLARIQLQLHVATFGPQDRIYDSDAPLERLCLLQEGTVRIEAAEPTAPQYCRPGQVLGLRCLMSGQSSPERAIALSEVRVITLARAMVLELSAELPRFSANLWRAAMPSVSDAAAPQRPASPARPARTADTPLPSSPEVVSSAEDVGDALALAVSATPVAPLPGASGPIPADAGIRPSGPVPVPEVADDPFLPPDPPRQRSARRLSNPLRNMTRGGRIRAVLTGLALLWLLQTALRQIIGI